MSNAAALLFARRLCGGAKVGPRMRTLDTSHYGDLAGIFNTNYINA